MVTFSAFTDYKPLDFSGLNKTFDDISKKRREDKQTEAVLKAFDQSQGGSAPAQQGSPLTALGQPQTAAPITPVRSSPLAALGSAPVAETEADTQRLEAQMAAGTGAFAPKTQGAGGSDLARLFSTKENEFGLPPGYLAKTAQVESSGNPNAQNRNSSAGGLFQFIDKTAAQYGLANKFDPVASTDAAARLAADNKRILTGALGREPTAGELYLAHQQGAGGAVKLLRNPEAPVEQVVGPEAARLNGGAGLTAGQFAAKWTSKVDGGQNVQMAQAPAQPGAPMADAPAPGAAEAQGFAVPGGGQPQPATRQNVNGQMIRTLLANPETRNTGLALWQQAQTGKQFGFQVVGDQLYRTNPSTGQVEPVAGVQKPGAVLDQRLKALDIIKRERDLQGEGAIPLTPEERQQFGITGTLPAYKTRDGSIKFGPAGTTIVNEAQKLESEEGKLRTGINSKFIGKLADSGPQISQRMADLDILASVFRDAPPGPTSDAQVFIDRVGAGLGLSKGELATRSDAMKAIIQRLAPAQREEGSGSTSDIEFKGMLASFPSLSATQEGRQMILTTIARQNELTRMRVEVANQWTGGEIPATEARKRIAQIDRASIFASEDEKKLVRKLASTSKGGELGSAGPALEREVGGKRYVQRGGQWYAKDEN